ncbi:hypothetical protein KEM52_001871, partial [Ascosphaera acerosa]
EEKKAPGIPATSVWAKQAVKPAAAPAKKTLAQIQKEEEARKQKLAAQQAAATNAGALAAATTSHANAASGPGSGTSTPSAGKRYADLAGKMAQQAQATGGGAWTTVGAGGKVKAPAPPTPTTRSAPAVAATAALKPRSVSAAPVKASTVSSPSGTATAGPSAAANSTTRAMEELGKWAKNALRGGMNSSINVDDFVQQLAILPAEGEIIADCVYAHSTTLDGRRFGEEYVRKRKLADKGIVESSGSGGGFGIGGNGNAEGWNEVAKKGPVHARQHEDHPAEFKVVSKKKGKR